MANFLITTPNSLTQGTDTVDLFVLNTAFGTTVFAGGGADSLSAVGTNFSNANLQGGAGNDSIYLGAQGAKTLLVTQILAGAGNDTILLGDGVTNTTTLEGGGGGDVINILSGTYGGASTYGNLGSDFISAYNVTFSAGLVAAGGDNDTIRFSSTIGSTTINGGGGADSIVLNGAISAIRLEGDFVGDAQFYGNDTIGISAGLTKSSFVQGGGGADIITVSGLESNSTVLGNQGGDSIFINDFAAAAGNFVGGGAGNDTIRVSADLAAAFGTIQGGGGIDLIDVDDNNVVGGDARIFGGADADTIELGTLADSFTTARGINSNASGMNVGYQSFDQSNLLALDVISAASTTLSAGGVFTVTQSAVNFSAVAIGNYGAGGAQVTVATGARVTTFAAGIADTLTAKATALDNSLGEGGAVVFRANAVNYLFVQGGAAGSGTGNDLVAQLNVGGFTVAADTLARNGGIQEVNNSAIKIGITNNTTF